MFASLDAPLAAAPSPQPADPRATRLAKFKREQRIVEYLNRGVSVVEIAAQMGLSEKRMHAVVRDILDRRMPHPPKEFVAIQASRLNEALLVTYSAMSLTNLKAVDQVVKIVRELDRYQGLSALAGRRRFEPDELAAPDEGAVAYGGAFVCRAEWAAADDEDLALEHETQGPLAALERGEVWPPAGASRPGFQPQAVEKIDSAPGSFEAEALAPAAGAASDPGSPGCDPGMIRGDAAIQPDVERPAASRSPRLSGARDDDKGHETEPSVSTPPRPDNRPEFSRPEFSPQAAEKIDSAPGRVEPEALARTLVVASDSRFGDSDPGIIRLDAAIRPDVERRAASESPRPFGARDDGEGHATERGASTPRPEDRPEISPQHSEKIDSAPGILEAPGDADAARGETRVSAPAKPGPAAPPAAAPADVRPEFSLQAPEKIDSAPGNGERSDAAPAAPPEFPVIRMPILTSTGLKFVNARRTPNGMVAC